MKRVFFVTRCFNTTFNTGAARTLFDVATGLAKLGWEIHLVATQSSYQDFKNKSKSNMVSGIRFHQMWNINFPLTSSLRRSLNILLFHLNCIYILLRLLKKNDIVVATTDPPLVSVPIAWIARLRGVILVNWLLDIYPEVAERLGFRLVRGWRSKTLRSLCNRSWKEAKYNIVLGEHMADFVRNQGFNNSNILIHPSWEDSEIVNSSSVDNSLRRQWNMESNFVFGYFGNMGRAHHFETIVDAALELKNIHSDIKFLFVGYGYYHNYLEKKTIENNLDNIILKPYQSTAKFPDALALANVHIITMRPNLEGLLVPTKLYSAMAAARPIIFIGNQDGEVARILKKFSCGTIVQMGDVDALSQIILYYKNNPTQCEKEGKNARVAFEKHFTKSIAIKRWNELLESIT